MSYINLKPNVRLIEIIGGVGTGKTEIATVPADSKARKILIKGIGRTNSTLNEKIFVYTDEQKYENKMVIAVKYEENPFTRNQFTEIVSESIAQVVKTFGKFIVYNIENGEKALEEILKTQLLKKNNIKNLISLLTKEQVEQFISGIVALYCELEKNHCSYNIYNAVKNEMDDVEVKENSKKFLSAIQQEVEYIIDIQNDAFKNDLWSVYDKINRNLSDVFFHYFNPESISQDGYYYKEIILNNPDTKFINAMFTANNTQLGQKISLEVLCSAIVLYIPMNKIFSKLIADNPVTSKVFRDSSNNIIFGTIDTCGLYNIVNTENENAEYCYDLFYRDDIDAIAITAPLENDANEKRISKLCRDIFKNYTKQIPIFMVHNKFDLYVSSFLKKDFDDPLSLKIVDKDKLSEDRLLNSGELIESLTCHMGEVSNGFRIVQGVTEKKLHIKSLPCYLKRDINFPQKFIKDFNVLIVYETILTDIAKSFEDSAVRIKLEVEEGVIPKPIINEDRLLEILHAHAKDKTTNKKVFIPGMADIAHSIGKRPHNSAYTALRCRLKNNEGYTTNIDEKYFYNCKSFSVNFTANLRNFASCELIHSVVFQTLSVPGVKYTTQNRKKFYKTVEKYVNPKKLISLLLFYNAIQDAEKNTFSFKNKFQNFLQNSMNYFNPVKIDETAYAVAIKQIVLEAANRAIDLNVTFK